MSSQKTFASTGDLAEKKISFTEIGPDLYAFTAEGDPNTGVIVGDDSCAVFDAQATPDGVRAAGNLSRECLVDDRDLRRIRRVVLVEVAPREELYAECLEVVVADPVEVRVLGLLRPRTVHPDVIAPGVVEQRDDVGLGRVLDAGHSPDAREQLAPERQSALGRELQLREVEARDDDALLPQARVEVWHARVIPPDQPDRLLPFGPSLHDRRRPIAK